MAESSIYIVSAVLFALNTVLLNTIQSYVPQPYMDEIFHVPQAQHYCDGNYTEWDNKITTLPGLYLLSTTIIRLASSVLQKNVDLLCNTYILRFTNVVLASGLLIVLFKIINEIHKKGSNNLKILNAFAISLFPLNYFFQYLYYTDIGSTFFCLIAYYFQLKGNYNFSAIYGVISVLYRQTNIIWVIFYFSLILINNAKLLIEKSKTKKTQKISILLKYLIETPINTNLSINDIVKRDVAQSKVVLQNLFTLLCNSNVIPSIISILLFGLFIFYNNGIVVGDRSNHEASVHLCQLFYFFTFTIIFSASHIFLSKNRLVYLTKFIYRCNFYTLISAILLFIFVIKYYTYEHPFLLADNRHYTFYIWSKIYRRHFLIKFFMIPIYLVSITAFYRVLIENRKSLAWIVSFTICFSLCLIPQKLIEFRYFLIPFIIFRLNLKCDSLKYVVIEILFYLAINFVTVYLFLYRTFYWTNSNDLQRFMW